MSILFIEMIIYKLESRLSVSISTVVFFSVSTVISDLNPNTSPKVSLLFPAITIEKLCEINNRYIRLLLFYRFYAYQVIPV